MARVVHAEYQRGVGELPRRIPEGISWSYACSTCGNEFKIQPVLSLVAFQGCLAVLISLLIIQGIREADRVTGRALLFGALAFIAWLAWVALVTVDRVRMRRRYPLLDGHR